MMCKKQLSLGSWKRERKSDGQKVISAHMLLWGENSGISYAVFEYKKKVSSEIRHLNFEMFILTR